MAQINVIGSLLDSSGYSIHTRNLVNALSKYVDVKLSSSIPQGAETLLTDKEVELLKKPSKNEINLIITSPTYWRLNTNAKRNWVYLIFEGDRIPKYFLNECLNPDIEYIFVASNHTKQAVLNSLEDVDFDEGEIISKIKIIPHGVNLELFYPKEKNDNIFRFFCNKGFRNLEDRGGIQYAVKAYLEEFTDKDNVELYLKLNPAYGVPDLNNIFRELYPRNINLPPIRINADNIPYNKLVDLYSQSNVLVAPSRSDAFNIPCIESMACGVPVITTNFGGQTDFCNDTNGWIIDGKLTDVTWELQYEGIKWLTPNINELRNAMREAYENRELLTKKSEESLKTSKEWTWSNTSKKIMEVI